MPESNITRTWNTKNTIYAGGGWKSFLGGCKLQRPFVIPGCFDFSLFNFAVFGCFFFDFLFSCFFLNFSKKASLWLDWNHFFSLTPKSYPLPSPRLMNHSRFHVLRIYYRQRRSINSFVIFLGYEGSQSPSLWLVTCSCKFVLSYFLQLLYLIFLYLSPHLANSPSAALYRSATLCHNEIM